MANFLLCLLIFRIVLPIILGACISFRPSVLSAIYFLFLLILPCIPIPTISSMAGASGLYLKFLIATSVLTFISQLAFQIVLLSMPPYGHFLENCKFLEELFRHIGFVRLDNMSAIDVITWISPEIMMLITSIGIYIVCNKLLQKRELEVVENQEDLPQKGKAGKKQFALFVAVGKYAVLVALCVAAVLRPSVPGGLYFLVFLSAATWWSCCRELGKCFAIVMRCLMVVVVVHICALYTYQFPWPQEHLDSNSTYARYFGLTQIFAVNCTGDPRSFIWLEAEWATYVNPAALYILYYVLALESKFLLKPQLISGVSPSRRYGSGKKPGSTYDPTGSFTVATDDIPMDQLDEEYKPTLLENIMFGLESVLQVIIKSSYIVTNIIMMAWSITYISWITFVLLLWANLLWLIPNQRKSMLRSSPFLVTYAWFLLISAYIYSMNLTEDELPTTVNGVDLEEIGFQRNLHLPCNPLLVKCLFTTMFWITLRQFVREKIEERQTNALADMAAPLQVTVGTAATEDEQDDSSKWMDKVGKYLRKILIRLWIWVVACTLFAVAITGERMTAFRVIYMALFLFFILTFQISFRCWRKMMFGFWLTIIVFSMAILVMTYTYQFKNFDVYWEEYLHVSKQEQQDIGLEKFATTKLFMRLVIPTFFVIICVVQVHYFHKDFMELSDPKNASVIGVELDQSSLQGGARTPIHSEKDESISIKEITDTDSSQTRWQRWYKTFNHVVNLIFLFLELHMPKFVTFFLMLVCIYDKCALYLLLVFLIVLSCAFGRPMQIFAIYSSSIFVSFMLLARMVYQTEYINPQKWNVTCRTYNNSRVENIVIWLGFNKTSHGVTLPGLVKWNIMYILVVTIWAVVLVRQFNYRVSRGKPTTRAFFMFPKITRTDADKSLRNYAKYLLNYGFYKFGVEICLMATVTVIGFRMDMYSIIYSLWLCVLFSCKRKTLSKIWNLYMIFIAILLPVQYVMSVGLPPTLCIIFPWDVDYWPHDGEKRAEIYRKLQDWAYLLDTEYPPSAIKLVFDFILLLLVSRQAVVFRIEKRWAGRDYPGGSNESVIHHAEEKNFVNPVPDYISTIRSYLDVLKNGIFSSFIWITLAIVFLAGTNRVNIFSIGYLVGAFIFLWQGTDLYLRPIPKIIKSWDLFLGYNIFVILCKVSLQIVGCIFLHNIPIYACWLVQLFGIGCVKKFEDLTIKSGVVASDVYCKVPREYVGLVWDGLCFGFMIIQRRIFQSYNFFHLINEIKAATILASRGAELIEELRQRRMMEQEEQEHRVLEKIKAKMDKIKANQQKIQGSSYKDTDNHYVDTIFKGRPKRRRKEPKTYKQAVRSGDYYMFDDLDDEEELDFIETAKEEYEEEHQGQTIGQIEEGPRVKIVDEREPKPGTSRDEDESVTEEQKPTVREKVQVGFLFAWAFIQSSMVSLTNFLNKYSRDYRYVIRVLAKEKKYLKEHTDYNVGLRMGSGQLWQPAGSYGNLIRQSRGGDSQMEVDDYEVTEMSSYDQPPIIRLMLAIWYIIMSRSENLCYFIIFLNQIKSATFLSLPLPLMVFLWGTLTIPRPDKTFWVTIIAYTEIIVLVKCMFQFELIPWNQNQAIITNPLYPPRIIGIEQKPMYAVWDLLLLLVVFFHRFMLKSMGLWRSTPTPGGLLSEGVYRVTPGGNLETIDSAPSLLSRKSSPQGGGSRQSARSSPSRASDLQRLMEESDELEEDRLKQQPRLSLTEEIMENKIVSVKCKSVEPLSALPTSIKIAIIKYGDKFKVFFRLLLDPTSRVAADVYSYMFLCDFYNFFVLLIGNSSFGYQQGDGGVSSYLEDDRVPVQFLVMLILQFALIIVDRGIFLRKNITAKIIFQFVQIFVLHIWLFILFPVLTERGFNSVIAPQMYYMVKCFYLLLSAYQIRCGYPTRILGNFLCKGYNYVNLFLFKGFMAVPFLFELRTVMDWMWTDTSMTVFDWIKMEDIFSHIFQIKCSRHVEEEYPQPRGERKAPLIKYLMGGAILALIIAIIWFPLVFFSLGNAVGTPNPPYDVSLEIRIGPYEPVYTMSAQSNFISTFTESNFLQFGQTYIQQKSAATVISKYEADDIAAVKLSEDSANIWSISPPDRERMLTEVSSNNPLKVRLEYKVSHKTSKPEDSGVIPDNVEVSIPATFANGTKNPMRERLLEMLKGNTTAPPMIIEKILPKFLKVTNRGTAKPVMQLMFKDKEDSESPEPEGLAFRTISLRLERSNDTEWWYVQEQCGDDFNWKKFLSHIPHNNNCSSIMLYTFNDKIFPQTLSILTGGGVFGLYALYFFACFRLFRMILIGSITNDIWLEDMPNVNRIYILMNDIYIVRAFREYRLEEDLFAKLVFLMRSRELAIKVTRNCGDTYDPDIVWKKNK